jgi:hypothetical protein
MILAGAPDMKRAGRHSKIPCLIPSRTASSASSETSFRHFGCRDWGKADMAYCSAHFCL